MSVQEAARMLNVSTKTVYRWVTSGQIPAYRVNKQHRFDRAELLEWARVRRLEVTSPFELDLDHPDDATPTLERALESGGIHYRVSGADPVEVLRSAVAVLRISPTPEQLHGALCAREELASTAVGGGFAIPYVQSPLRVQVRQAAVGLCLLDHPVDWGAPDGVEVSALWVVVGATLRQVTRLRTHVAFALRDPSLCAAVLAHASREVVAAEVRRVGSAFRPWPTP
ncbi:MAG: helix-turn-helix domain-containing protein [Myxococcota bacterium]